MFVIEKYDVSYSPSLSFLYVLNEKLLERKIKDKCLIIGDPYYNLLRSRGDSTYFNVFMNKLEKYGYSLDPLPYAKQEALMIKNVIKRKRAIVCLNGEASEDNLKKMNLKKYNIIHFACHGFIDEEAPTRSALVLSNKEGSKQDGLLQVGEIYDLELDADLVVLSACQTGRGQIARGEGILGLTRTFFYSGARSVISTLWSINDISTAIFMRHFYIFLSEGMTKSEALRSAKMKMIYSQYNHPFYWAAFILNGDYKSKFDWH
jgi:CHAT domain-containing protein